MITKADIDRAQELLKPHYQPTFFGAYWFVDGKPLLEPPDEDTIQKARKLGKLIEDYILAIEEDN